MPDKGPWDLSIEIKVGQTAEFWIGTNWILVFACFAGLACYALGLIVAK